MVMAELDKAGMQIDIDGKGVMDVFNPYLPVTYVRSRVALPQQNSNSNYEASFDFSVPSDLVNPYFWVESGKTSNAGYFYYFTPLGGLNWRVTLWGRVRYYLDSNGRVYSTDAAWTEPLMKNDMFVVIGGFRG